VRQRLGGRAALSGFEGQVRRVAGHRKGQRVVFRVGEVVKWHCTPLLLAMLPRVFSVMVTQRRSGFESRNIRFEGPSSNM
jgi:hypothetical protein